MPQHPYASKPDAVPERPCAPEPDAVPERPFSPTPDAVPEKTLAAERNAMRRLLMRVTTEVDDLETLCKHIPRIVSVATTTARIQAALDSAQEPELADKIRKLLTDVEHEEATPW